MLKVNDLPSLSYFTSALAYLSHICLIIFSPHFLSILIAVSLFHLIMLPSPSMSHLPLQSQLLLTGLFGWVAGLIWGASNMLFTAAVQRTAVANVLVIVASNTVFSSVFSYMLLGELIPLRMWITSFICFGAIALIFSGNEFVLSKFRVALLNSASSHFRNVHYFLCTLGDLGGGSGQAFGSILAVIASVTQGLFFSMIRYKYAKGEDVTNTDVLCYNVVASIGVCVGKRQSEREKQCFSTCFSSSSSNHYIN